MFQFARKCQLLTRQCDLFLSFVQHWDAPFNSEVPCLPARSLAWIDL
jgi:hypothetical protein